MVDITVEGGYTGIRNLSHGIEIYPNPAANGFIQLFATEGIAGVEIYNLTGKRISTQANTDSSSQMQVSLNDVDTGLYMLKVVFSDDSMTSRKIFVK